MTPKEEEVYTFIVKHHADHGAVPSTTKTADHFGVSKQRIQVIYSKLVTLGKIINQTQEVAYFKLP